MLTSNRLCTFPRISWSWSLDTKEMAIPLVPKRPARPCEFDTRVRVTNAQQNNRCQLHNSNKSREQRNNTHNTMKELVTVVREIVIDDDVDTFNINSTTEQICRD